MRADFKASRMAQPGHQTPYALQVIANTLEDIRDILQMNDRQGEGRPGEGPHRFAG